MIGDSSSDKNAANNAEIDFYHDKPINTQNIFSEFTG